MTTQPRARFWSNITALAYREASVLRHDKTFLVTVFMQLVAMLLLQGYVLTNKPANVPWAVLDRNQTEVSRRLVEDIRTTGYFLPPVSVASYEEGRALLKNGDALALLVIPSSLRRDFERGRPRVQLLLDGSDPLSAARVADYIGRVAGTFQIGTAPHGHDPDAPVRGRRAVDIRQRFWFNPTLKESIFFIAALAGMTLTNFCFSATGQGLVGEKEQGTYEQVLSLPTTAVEIVLGKLLPHVVLGYALMVLAIVAPGLMLGFWPKGSWLALFLVTAPFLLASLAIGVFISTLAKNSAQAVFLTVFFIMPSFVLSGVLLPYQLMPDVVRHIGGMLPLRWYQIALRRITERGAGVAEIVGPMLVLFVLFLVLLTAIRWRMKPRLG
jgi:ABC-2 type transport system permease protein